MNGQTTRILRCTLHFRFCNSDFFTETSAPARVPRFFSDCLCFGCFSGFRCFFTFFMSAPRPKGRGALCAKPMYRSERTVPRRKSFFRRAFDGKPRFARCRRFATKNAPCKDAVFCSHSGASLYLLLMHGTVGSNRLRARRRLLFAENRVFLRIFRVLRQQKAPRAVGAGAKTGISRRKPVSFKNQTVVRFIRASVRLPPKARQPLPGGSSSAYIPRRAHDRRRRIFRKVPTRPLPRPCAPTLSTYLSRFP